MTVIERKGPFYLTYAPERRQPYTLRRVSGWRNDRHLDCRRDPTLGFYSELRTALAALETMA